MAQRTAVSTTERVKQLHKRIEHWRSSRVKLWPMPESLWTEATALARELGVYRVSRALRLNYESLRRRVGRKGRGGGAAGTKAGEFVELSGAQLLGLPAGPVVELFDEGNVRLTVRLASGSALDVVRLVEVFRGRPA